jgi:hypothetical protein
MNNFPGGFLVSENYFLMSALMIISSFYFCLCVYLQNYIT